MNLNQIPNSTENQVTDDGNVELGYLQFVCPLLPMKVHELFCSPKMCLIFSEKIWDLGHTEQTTQFVWCDKQTVLFFLQKKTTQSSQFSNNTVFTVFCGGGAASPVNI